MSEANDSEFQYTNKVGGEQQGGNRYSCVIKSHVNCWLTHLLAAEHNVFPETKRKAWLKYNKLFIYCKYIPSVIRNTKFPIAAKPLPAVYPLRMNRAVTYEQCELSKSTRISLKYISYQNFILWIFRVSIEILLAASVGIDLCSSSGKVFWFCLKHIIYLSYYKDSNLRSATFHKKANGKSQK